jgi:hypothetical protein
MCRTPRQRVHRLAEDARVLSGLRRTESRPGAGTSCEGGMARAWDRGVRIERWDRGVRNERDGLAVLTVAVDSAVAGTELPPTTAIGHP